MKACPPSTGRAFAPPFTSNFKGFTLCQAKAIADPHGGALSFNDAPDPSWSGRLPAGFARIQPPLMSNVGAL
jgi:hypothetical protein